MRDDWDLVIIGGGITGAGIFNLAARLGMNVLLLEKGDFASGTSSKSSKLVHGGLRYLRQGQVGLTMESVKERERLLHEAPGLVIPLQFALPIYNHQPPSKMAMESGLTLYDMMAQKKGHEYFGRDEFASFVPHIRTQGMKGGFLFSDAQVDDARLVLRLIFEAEDLFPRHCMALNYQKISSIKMDSLGYIEGVIFSDSITGVRQEVTCHAIINASGASAENLHPIKNSNHKDRTTMHIRPLRGSHLVFPFWKLPIGQAISFFHPQDKRPVFLLPWEGVILVGTTDVDHDQDEPSVVISAKEKQYLMEAVNYFFPGKHLGESDLLSTFSGVRPVLSTGQKKPSEESRESEVWSHRGMISITGGKLTTFRKLAEKALHRLISHFRKRKGSFPKLELLKQGMLHGANIPVFSRPEPLKLPPLAAALMTRLEGRYGAQYQHVINEIRTPSGALIPGSTFFWSELTHAVQHEKVRHLDDLMLRRTRIGLTSSNGGHLFLPGIRSQCSPLLDWDNSRWESEINRYERIWNAEYAPGQV